MNRGKEPHVSLCERQFVLEAIKEGKRLDGRDTYDYRSIEITPSSFQAGCVEASLGKTRVLANVSCELVRPRPQRPTEGEMFFNIELSPMASPAFEVGRSSPMATELARMLERCLKESRAVDMESLCVIAGEKVWSVRVDVHVLDMCGNITDCATIASIAALKHFRRPDVTVVGEEATIHPLTERDPIPLSVHHMPFCVSFAFFSEGDYLLVDPDHVEETVMDGRLVVGMNVHREICVLGMAGGVSLLPQQLLRCTKIAAVKCQELTDHIQNSLSSSNIKSDGSVMKSSNILVTQREVEQEEEIQLQQGVTEEMEEKEEEEEMVEEDDKEEVIFLGEGTAQVGLGGRSQWKTTDSKKDEASIENEDDSDVIIIGEEPKERVSSSDDGEEDVVVLTETDIRGFMKSDTSRMATPTGGSQRRRGRGGGGRGGGRGGGGILEQQELKAQGPATADGGKQKRKRRKKPKN